MSTGIRKRGSSYEASVWVARDDKRMRKSFPSLREAKAWRKQVTREVHAGTLTAPSTTTLAQAWSDWLDAADKGLIRNRSGDRYKPSALHGYEQAMRMKVLPRLGKRKVSALERRDLQGLADQLLADGFDPSTIRNAIIPVRVLFRRLLNQAEVFNNPTTGLTLPAVRGSRDRVVSPEEAERLLGALLEAQRPLWATALYAGLRRGELMALRFEDLDFEHGLIRVERSYDPKAYLFVEPKSRAGRRTVPMAGILRTHLLAAKLSSGRFSGLVFSENGERVFNDRKAAVQAYACWRDQGLEPVTLHECRHTFASLMIRSGVNVKSLATYMGHASIVITLDRYGHLFPGNEAEAASLLDAYLTGN